MCKIFLVFLISLFAIPLFSVGSIFTSDEKTFGIFPSFYYVEHGWFIGPVAQINSIAGNSAFSLDGRIGWRSGRLRCKAGQSTNCGLDCYGVLQERSYCNPSL